MCLSKAIRTFLLQTVIDSWYGLYATDVISDICTTITRGRERRYPILLFQDFRPPSFPAKAISFFFLVTLIFSLGNSLNKSLLCWFRSTLIELKAGAWNYFFSSKILVHFDIGSDDRPRFYVPMEFRVPVLKSGRRFLWFFPPFPSSGHPTIIKFRECKPFHQLGSSCLAAAQVVLVFSLSTSEVLFTTQFQGVHFFVDIQICIQILLKQQRQRSSVLYALNSPCVQRSIIFFIFFEVSFVEIPQKLHVYSEIKLVYIHLKRLLHEDGLSDTPARVLLSFCYRHMKLAYREGGGKPRL